VEDEEIKGKIENPNENLEKEKAELEAKKIAAEEEVKRTKELIDVFKKTLSEVAPSQKQEQVKQWSEEEWKNYEEKTGLNREQLAIMDSIAKSHSDHTNKEISERLKLAEAKAKAAEDKLSSFEGSRNYDGSKKTYFKDKPELKKYENDIDSFLSKYPKDMLNDPATLKELLGTAEIYIRGKVGEKNMKGFKRGDDVNEDEEDIDSIDTTGLRSYEKNTLARIYPSKESKELLKKYRHDIQGDAGVQINGKEEWDRVEKSLRKNA